ncbi:GroES (chaperonin 10)-like protein [Hyaloscypha variabilis]
MVPSEMTALALNQRSWPEILFNAIQGKGISHGASVKKVQRPSIRPSEVLVKVYSVACNPTDVAHIDIVGPAHSIVGCEYSGVVEEVGTAATDVWKVGDRIAGAVHGGLFPDKGAFAEYRINWITR